MAPATTPSQTIGPFFRVLRPLAGAELVPRDHPAAIVIEGSVRDGAGAAVSDALIEIWQADPAGIYAHPEDPRLSQRTVAAGFGGFGRCYTDGQGGYSFVTVKPGRVQGFDERMQAPHISVGIFARGLLARLVTRLYFPDEAAANAADPVLTSIEGAERRGLLVAREAAGSRLRFDIRLQGEGETPFFAV